MSTSAKSKYGQNSPEVGSVMGLGQWGEKFKSVVECLAWQQIKAVNSLNPPKTV